MKKLLDVGCGPGTVGNVGYYQSIKTDYQIYGIDMLKQNIVLIRKRFPSGIFSVGNAEKLPYKNSYFDAVVMHHVLEHVSNLEKTLDEVKRVTKSGAYITIAVPHKNLEIVLNNLIKHYLEKNHHHQRVFSQRLLEQVLKENGFVIASSTQEKWPMFIITFVLACVTRLTKNITMQEQSGVFLLQRKNYLEKKSLYPIYNLLYTFFSFLNNVFPFPNFIIPFEIRIIARKI